MDDLLKKFLDGEITKEQYDQQVGALSEEDKKKHDELLAKPEMQAQLRKKADDELARIGGLRKEGSRIEDKGNSDFAKKLREENIGKAKARFFKDFNIPAEQQAEYSTAFEKSGNQDVSEDYIYDALEQIYASKNSKTLIQKSKERDTMVQSGEEFMADSAGAPGSGAAGGEPEKKRDPRVLQWMKESKERGVNISYEDAERVLNRGTTRVFS